MDKHKTHIQNACPKYYNLHTPRGDSTDNRAVASYPAYPSSNTDNSSFMLQHALQPTIMNRVGSWTLIVTLLQCVRLYNLEIIIIIML